MASSTYYGFWDYWNLYNKVTFDGVNRLILINEGETTIDMQIDVYSAWKEWALLEQNLKFLPPFSIVGGEPTVGDERLDVTYFLINGWRFKPSPGSYDLTIIGNVYDVDGGDIKVPANVDRVGDTIIPNNITITTNRSNIVRVINTETNSGGSGSIGNDTIVSASLFGVQEDSLYNIEGRVVSIESILSNPITASLEPTQSAQLTSIQETVVSSSVDIQMLLDMNYSQSLQISQLLSANISQSLQLSQQESQLEFISSSVSSSAGNDDRIREIWELHGLDENKPLTVNQTSRTFGDVDQTITTTGTGSNQETTIIRNP